MASKQPADPSQHLSRANGQLDLGHHAEALQAYTEILAAHPETSEDEIVSKALAGAMTCAAELADWSGLEILARRAISVFPQDPAGAERMAQALAGQGRGDEAAGAVRKSKKMAVQARAQRLYDVARELKKGGRLGEALAAYQQVLANFSRTATDSLVMKSLNAASTCATETGDWPAAQALAEHRIEAFPKDPDGYDQLAQALDHQGRENDAALARTRGARVRAAAQPPQLTILTVVLKAHYAYIRQQLALIETLNPGTPFKLLVVDNTGPEAPGLAIDDPRCEVIPGVASDPSLPEHGRGSYHHAAALNMALKRVDTPWLLVLDPDFFVVYRNWIDEVQDHMRRRSLSLFGVPWHYSWNRKWRYFPCVHMLMIDLKRVDPARLDFTPALLDDAETSNSPIHQWMRQHAPILRNRLLLEQRRDTGWKLHRDFRGKGVADMALPVVETRVEFRAPARLSTAAGRWLERRLPRRFSILPAPGTYLEPDQATGFRYPPIRSLAPERFVWRGAPFAVHLRGNMREDMRTSANPPYKERAATKELLEAVAGARSWTEWAFSVATSD